MHRITTSIILSILVLGLFLLAGCDSDEGAPTEAPTATQAAVDTPEPTIEPTPVPEDAATPTTEPVEEAAMTLVDILASTPGLEKFAEAVEGADLTEKLQSDGPFTVFVAVNIAFDNLPPGALDDPDVLQDIMLLHIVAEEITIESLIEQQDVTTLLGDELTTLLATEGATVGGANVLAVDIKASNGLIHVLDTLILPAALEDDVMALYPSVVGERTYPMQGNLHINHAESSPVAYNSTPPTSGPHYPNIVAWQSYDEPFAYEQLVHNLEDGGVIVYYQCEEPCPDLVAQLTDVVQPYMDNGRHVVLLPNDPTWTQSGNGPRHEDMGAVIAVTAWQKLLKLETLDPEKIEQFIDSYEGIDHHVRFN